MLFIVLASRERGVWFLHRQLTRRAGSGGVASNTLVEYRSILIGWVVS